MERVTFQNKANTVVGDLFQPEGFKQGSKYAAVVVTHPFGAVKEQVPATCAKLLAAQGLHHPGLRRLLPGRERRRAVLL
jgi:uncharacterized protein